jgi:PAS domain S-box-containing protein
MSGRVLLVSPDERRAGAVVPALRAAAGTVTVAESGADGVRTLGAGDPTDCVVVDHCPPDFDGLGFVDRVSDRRPDLSTVLFPGAAGDERLAGRAVEAGVDCYVPGGEDDVDRLRERVTDLLAGSDPDTGHAHPRRPPGRRRRHGHGDGRGWGRRAGVSRPDGGLRTVPEGVDVDGEMPAELKRRVLEEAPVGVTVSDPSLPDNPLVYVNEAFEEMTGYDREEALGSNCRFLQGEGTDPEPIRRMAEAVAVDEPVAVELLNYRKDGEEFWNRVDIAPLRDDDGEVTHYVGFQTDVTERKRAEFAVERYAEQLDRERAALDRVVDRVQGLVRDAAEALVAAGTRSEVAEAVCDLLGRADSYDGAWMADLDLGSDRLTVTTASGLGEVVGESISLADVEDPGAPELLPDGATPRDPAAVAAASGDPQTVERVGDLPADSLHRRVADDGDALAAVPVEYRDTCYGVLTVYADDAAVVDERERTVVAALGRMVATGINAVETKTTLTADDVVTLELDVADPDLFFTGISGGLDCSLDHAGTVSREDGSRVVFVTVRGASGDSVVEAAADHPAVTEAGVLTEAERETLVELVVGDDSLLADLADYGARLRDLSASDGTARLTLDVPPGTTARSVVDLVESHEGGALAAYHENDDAAAAPTTRGDFVSRLRDRLTDRQLSALQRAYLGGYFEWPREADGDDLAETMGVSRSTFHQHLRAAERKLLAAVFADDG